MYEKKSDEEIKSIIEGLYCMSLEDDSTSGEVEFDNPISASYYEEEGERVKEIAKDWLSDIESSLEEGDVDVKADIEKAKEKAKRRLERDVLSVEFNIPDKKNRGCFIAKHPDGKLILPKDKKMRERKEVYIPQSALEEHPTYYIWVGRGK